MCKTVFIDRYEHSDIVKDWNNFLIKMENLKPYIVKFKEDNKIKPKIYLDCIIKRSN